MAEAIVITPVKDSLETTKRTILAVSQSVGNFSYYIFNDFSSTATKTFLEENQEKFNYQVIHLENITSNPSPNYNLVLVEAQKMALEKKVPLIIIESDVVVQDNTILSLIKLGREKDQPGIIGAITVDSQGNYNFPYEFEKVKSGEVVETNHRISFCCTLITHNLLQKADFNDLPKKKDWYDIYLSRRSKKLGFLNYLAKGLEVQHLPHSSRPWKQLKYEKPIKYYIHKYLKKRDRI